MKIYFAGAIRGGRDDSDIYLQIVSMLTRYGTILTEHVGDPNLDVRGEELSDQQIYDRLSQVLAWVLRLVRRQNGRYKSCVSTAHPSRDHFQQ
jgi:hypothetical protein